MSRQYRVRFLNTLLLVTFLVVPLFFHQAEAQKTACPNTCLPGQIQGSNCVCNNMFTDPTAPASQPTPTVPLSQEKPNTAPCHVPGTRPAAPEDAAVKARRIKVGDCYNPNEVGIGQSAEEAKIYLNSLPNKCVGGCQAPPDKAHIDKLDSTFAICAANFFKEYQAKYGPVSISSAFRCGPLTPSIVQCDRSENKRAGGANASNHQLGLAIDVNPAGGNASYQTLWSFSKANPQLGICFPHQNGSTATGYPDRPHMILAGTKGGEGSACAQMGITKPCNGLPSPTVYGGETPNSPYYSPGSPMGSSVPSPQSSSSMTPIVTSALAGALRTLFGMQQQQQQPLSYLPPSYSEPSQQVAGYGSDSSYYPQQYDQSSYPVTTTDFRVTSDHGSGSSTQFQTTSQYQASESGSSTSNSDFNSSFNANVNESVADSTSSNPFISSFVDAVKDAFFPASQKNADATDVEPFAVDESFQDSSEFATIVDEQRYFEDGIPKSDFNEALLERAGQIDGSPDGLADHVRNMKNGQDDQSGSGYYPSANANALGGDRPMQYASGTVAIERPSVAAQTFGSDMEQRPPQGNVAPSTPAERDASNFTTKIHRQASFFVFLVKLVQPFRGRDPHAGQAPQTAVE